MSASAVSAASAASAQGMVDKVMEEKDEEWEEVTGGADFPPMWDFATDNTLVGIYRGAKEVETKNGTSTVHTFSDVTGIEGEVQCWGAAILSARLSDIPEGVKVKIFCTGQEIPVKRGKARDFRVFAAPSAAS